MTIRIKVNIMFPTHKLCGFSVSHSIWLYIFPDSWVEDITTCPRVNCKHWTWKLTVSQLFVTPPLSMPAPPWHLLSERAGCSASSRVFEYHLLTGHEPPATCCTLSHIGHNGRRDVALSGANVSVSALSRLCTARLSEHHYGLQHGSTTSAFCYWDTALQKESQTWRSRKPGTETLMETGHHLVCSTDCTETTEKLLSIKNQLNNLAMKL